MTHLLIDADPIVYRCGFAVEKDGHVEPLAHALRAVNFQIEHIVRVVEKKYVDFDTTRLFLSGSENYRSAVATIRPYKGNRDPLHKPVHYTAIRAFLADRWGAETSSGNEADDEVSIAARKDDGRRHIVATIDKDLDQIPGVHYDYLRKVWYVVTHHAAERFFWIQCLAGDSIDNIPGCYRIGMAKATKLVDLALTEGVDVWQMILNTYESSMKKPGCPYTSRKPTEVALETARLVKLQEFAGQVWEAPATAGTTSAAP